MNWIIADVLREVAKKGAKFLGKLIGFLWGVFIDWLARAVDAVEAKLGMHILGSETFIQYVGEGFKEYSAHYSKIAPGRYRKDITIKKELAAVNDIPDEVRYQAMAMEYGQEMNITNETNQKLQLCI